MRKESHTPSEHRSGAAGESTPQLPKRRRGGQELPDEVQDRPEQNAGYDAAVRGEGDTGAVTPKDEAGVVALDPRQPLPADADLEVTDSDDRP